MCDVSNDGLSERLLHGYYLGKRAAGHKVHRHPKCGGGSGHQEGVAVIYN